MISGTHGVVKILWELNEKCEQLVRNTKAVL